MKIVRSMASAAVLALALVGAGSAQAAQYAVSYTTNLIGGGTSSFTGLLTTTDTANVSGFFTVTALTGQRDGFAATLADPQSIALNDNLFKPTANYFTVLGIAYRANGVLYNPYSSNVTLREFQRGVISDFEVTAVNSAVPEPATWAMMLMGFGGIGFAMRRRKNKVRTTVAYA